MKFKFGKKLVLITFLFTHLLSYADEGMWLPFLIQRNYVEMKKLGLKITPEEIYNVNQACLKDAIVNFGNFCTGEMISSEGLILTNHHCGFDAIQSHSSVEKDYLTQGFWAMNRSEELANPGLSVTFLKKMEDVTSRMIVAKTEDEKNTLIETIKKEYGEGTHYSIDVESFFNNNQYIVFVYEIYKDIRLVGAPPSSVGKFGGDTDNWMWPRHTGDFSLFRVYMGPDGKPAEYSTANVPYQPIKHLTISLKGIQKNDYTMVMGYPGSTDRYLTSYGVELAYDQSNPMTIKLRETRLKLMKEGMDANSKTKIQYASKYATISNYYKYFIGQNQGLRRLDVIADKQKEEDAYKNWAKENIERDSLYGEVLDKLKTSYDYLKIVNPSYVYLREAAFGSEALYFAYKLNSLYAKLKANPKSIDPAISEELLALADDFYKDYNPQVDKKITAALLQMYYNDIQKSLHPSIFNTIEKKYKGNFTGYVDQMFAKSILCDEAKFKVFAKNPSATLLEKDLAFACMTSILGDFRSKIGPVLGSIYNQQEELNQRYTEGILKQKSDKVLYPDANFTMRLTYGTVQDYYPRDAVYYNYYTTLDGIMEKEDSTNEEFIVPQKIKAIFKEKDFGNYTNADGKVPVCFITTNDITGGNSGSPVMNANGELIGCAFDGNWEAMSGDIIFEPALQRCICVDIRYILFIIDKCAGASHLIKEMTIVK
jgi:hypothetical protein